VDTTPVLLTIIVPVYNEAATVGPVLHRVLAAPYRKQVLVVDDGSTDRTGEVLKGWAAHPEVELLCHARNLGKGAAIRTALERARGLFMLIQDADLEYDPADFPRLLEPLLRGEAQAVYGSRYLQPRKLGHPWRFHRLAVGALNLAVRLLYGVRLTDEATCYKAFPTSWLRAMDLRCQGFEFCAEVTAKACRLGLTIREVPIHYEARDVRAGKKLRWQDGPRALAALWRWRNWRPGDRPAPVRPGAIPRTGQDCSVSGAPAAGALSRKADTHVHVV
jgi:glycosyltransferase involved in cell wall biosynthesis